MKQTVLAFALLCATGATAAAAAPGPFSTVQQFVVAFNSGDMTSLAATCASPSSVLDDFPPYAWHGATACADWAKAYGQAAKAAAWTDSKVTLGKPFHVAVTGNRAYVVVPADYSYKDHDKPVMQKGSILSVALERLPSGWKMTSWAWADR